MNAHGERIAQCQHIKLITTTSLPVQIDGEACKLKPSVIEVVHQNKAIMIKKVPLRSINAPLRGYVTCIQLSLLCVRNNSMSALSHIGVLGMWIFILINAWIACFLASVHLQSIVLPLLLILLRQCGLHTKTQSVSLQSNGTRV